jgi:type IV pilus biogenesis protein CpaD/CtpE
MKLLGIVLLAASAAGCASLEQRVVERPVPYEVRIPVEVPCKIEALEAPKITPNKEALKLNDRDLVLLLAEERESLSAFVLKAMAAIKACQ